MYIDNKKRLRLTLTLLIIASFLPACAPREAVVLAAPVSAFTPLQTVSIGTRTPSPQPSITPSLRPSQTLPPTWTPFVITLPASNGPWIIGYSVERRPIEVYQFGSGPVQKLIVAGIHGGNEWNTTALARELIAHLRDDPGIIPSDTTLYILPLLNPDGEARAHTVDGRVNGHGVDLNRNWDYQWKADWNRDGCWIYRPVTAGAYPGSESETAALVSFIKTHEIKAMISYHSAALGIFPGGIPPDALSVDLARAVAAVSPYPYPPIDTGCDFTGNMVDWASAQGIPALDIELSDHSHTELDTNLQVLKTFLAWPTK
jgi:predicted deacylase